MTVKQRDANCEILAICLSRGLKKLLQEVHWELRKSRSEIVRDAMLEYFKKRELSDETRKILNEVR